MTLLTLRGLERRWGCAASQAGGSVRGVSRCCCEGEGGREESSRTRLEEKGKQRRRLGAATDEGRPPFEADQMRRSGVGVVLRESRALKHNQVSQSSQPKELENSA